MQFPALLIFLIRNLADQKCVMQTASASSENLRFFMLSVIL